MKEYFPHDFNARTDPKLQEVLMELGLAGIGAYWCIIEQLYEQDGSLPLSSVKSIAFAFHVKQDFVMNLIKSFGLFSFDEEKFWSESVQKRLDDRDELSEKRRQNVMKRWGKVIDTEEGEYNGNTNVIQTEYNCNTIKIKENKKNNKKNNKKKKASRHSPPLSEAETSDPIPSKDDLKNERIDYEKLRTFFNEKAQGRFPQLQVMTEKRKNAIRARAAEHGKEAILTVIEKAVASSFLVGGNDRDWRANFDWMFRPTNFVKILEGNYDNKENGKAQRNSNGRRVDFAATKAEDYEGGF